MVLSPNVANQFEEQLRVLVTARHMVSEVVRGARQQLTYLDPSEGHTYAITYATVRDGEICMHAMHDLIWDVWNLYADLDRFSRRVFHQNGTTQ